MLLRLTSLPDLLRDDVIDHAFCGFGGWQSPVPANSKLGLSLIRGLDARHDVLRDAARKGIFVVARYIYLTILDLCVVVDEHDRNPLFADWDQDGGNLNADF